MIIRIAILMLSLLPALAFAKGGKEEYAVAAIPKNLLEHADIVVRSHERKIDIVSTDKVMVTEHYAITILNDDGLPYATLSARDDKRESIVSMKGMLFDAAGTLVTKLKKRDVREASSKWAFVSDGRYKWFRFDYAVYPFTVEYEVESIVHHTFNIPEWSPVRSNKCALVNAELSVSCPSSMNLRYRAIKLPAVPKTETVDGRLHIHSSLSNISAIGDDENMHPPYSFTTPVLMFSLDSFQLHGYYGSMRSWKDFGKFIYQLNAGRDSLPAAQKQMVHQITDTCTTSMSKIQLLFDHLRKTTRYVNIVFGIGGWQTAKATTVAEKGYGDCKALSNYMKALLKEAGVTSYQALVCGGSDTYRPILADFPHNTFNHVILFVPVDKDTLWLECTSDILPAGYLSSFTNARQVLLLKPDGGYIVSTPEYDTTTNVLRRRAYITAGKAESDCAIVEYRKGWWWERQISLLSWTTLKKEDYLAEKYLIPSYRIVDYKFEDYPSATPELYETINITAAGLIRESGSQALLQLDILQMPLNIPSHDDERRTPFYLDEHQSISDTLLLTLPERYTIADIPEPIELNFPFGSYTRTVSRTGNTKAIVASSFTCRKGLYPAASFKDYLHFCNVISAKNTTIGLHIND